MKTAQVRKQWNNILSSERKKSYQPRILYPVKISYKNQRKIKTFWTYKSGRDNCQQSALQRTLTEFHQAEGNDTRWKSGPTQENIGNQK